MKGWRDYKLKDVCIKITDGSHFSPQTVESGLPMASVKDMTYNNIDLNNCRKISHEDFEKLVKAGCKPDIDDILIAKDGSYLKHVIHWEKESKVVLLSSIAILTPNKALILPQFLKYLFLNQSFRDIVEGNFVTGAVIPRIVLKDFKEIAISIPPLPEQKAIAGVLSSLDDKIDLLHRQNKTLESLAETLFRQWFIEEAEEGWEEGRLGDEFSVVMGSSPPGNSYNEEGVGMPLYQGNADFQFRFPARRVYTQLPTRIAERFDTLISVRAPVGEQNMSYEKCCIGRGVAAIRYKSNDAFSSYTYYKIKTLMREIKQFNDTGTVFGCINKNDLEGLDINIPKKDIIEKFRDKIENAD